MSHTYNSTIDNISIVFIREACTNAQFNAENIYIYMCFIWMIYKKHKCFFIFIFYSFLIFFYFFKFKYTYNIYSVFKGLLVYYCLLVYYYHWLYSIPFVFSTSNIINNGSMLTLCNHLGNLMNAY